MIVFTRPRETRHKRTELPRWPVFRISSPEHKQHPSYIFLSHNYPPEFIFETLRVPANELLQIEKSRLSDIRRFEHRARGRRARKFYGKACRSYRRQFRSGTGDCSRVVRRGGPRCVLKFRVVTWYNATPSLPVCCHLQPVNSHLQPVNSHLRPVNGARGDLPISHGPPRSVPNFSHPVLPNRGQGTRRR
jgi:hypothetical protein